MIQLISFDCADLARDRVSGERVALKRLIEVADAVCGEGLLSFTYSIPRVKIQYSHSCKDMAEDIRCTYPPCRVHFKVRIEKKRE